ncbi:hypothetical protein PFISCL1PPCAC_23539, partial [Pristionchus fissidentatus]
TARMFAEKGAKLTITGRNAETLKITKDLCLASGARKDDIVAIIANLEDNETPAKIIDGTVKAFGGIDVLVNNAGMALNDSEGRTHMDMPVDNFDRTIQVNVRSILVLTQLAVPHLEKTKGAVVNVSSIAALPLGQTEFYYAISKAALDQLTVQMASNIIKKGIRVNSVNPGLVSTDIIRKTGIGEEAVKALLSLGENPKIIPLGRVGQSSDISKLILFLSDRSQSEFIIGQRIVIDGGSTLRNPLLSDWRTD